MSEITLDLRLEIKIPERGLTINGFIQGLKEGAPQIQGVILTTLMKALEERVIENYLERDPERYRRNGHRRQARQLKCSLGAFRYRFAQLVDRKKGLTFRPLVEVLSIPPHDQYLDEALEPSIGLTVHVSFRRATKEVERIQGQSGTFFRGRSGKCALLDSALHFSNSLGDSRGAPPKSRAISLPKCKVQIFHYFPPRTHI